MAVKQHTSAVRRALVSAHLDTSLTGTQCLALTQPTSTGSLPFIRGELPAGQIKVTLILRYYNLCVGPMWIFRGVCGWRLQSVALSNETCQCCSCAEVMKCLGIYSLQRNPQNSKNKFSWFCGDLHVFETLVFEELSQK